MDVNLLAVAIGIGLAVGVLLAEVFGVAAGGLVVPGYLALFLTQPVDVGLTLLAALATFVLVRLASSFVILYGRRRTALMILIGYGAGVAVDLFVGGGVVLQPHAAAAAPVTAAAGSAGAAASVAAAGGVQPAFIELSVIGFIIPGLIAIWMDRQGVVPTLAALITTAVVVRLILILVLPGDLQWFEAGNPSLIPAWLGGGAS